MLAATALAVCLMAQAATHEPPTGQARGVEVSQEIAKAGYKRAHAVLIGVDNYKQGSGSSLEVVMAKSDEKPNLNNLNYAESDAKAMKAFLLSMGYPEGDVQMLLGKALTKNSLFKAIASLYSLPVETCLVFYVGGHGVLTTNSNDGLFPNASEASFVFPSIDTSGFSGQPRVVIESFPLEGLIEAVQKSPPKHKLIVFDCCHAGGGIVKVSTWPEEAIKKFLAAPGTVILLSSMSFESSFELPSIGGGVLTQTMLKRCKREAEAGKAFLISDLLPDIRRDVAELMKARQIPVWKTLGEGQFMFFPRKG